MRIMRSDNLKRHKNSCKVARQGCGILFTPASNGIVSTRKLDIVHKRFDESEDSKSDESSVDEEESIADIVDDECDNQSMVSTIADDDSVNEEECEFGSERVDEDEVISGILCIDCLR